MCQFKTRDIYVTRHETLLCRRLRLNAADPKLRRVSHRRTAVPGSAVGRDCSVGTPILSVKPHLDVFSGPVQFHIRMGHAISVVLQRLVHLIGGIQQNNKSVRPEHGPREQIRGQQQPSESESGTKSTGGNIARRSSTIEKTAAKKEEAKMIYAVSYTLRPRRDVTDLTNTLQNDFQAYFHYLDDTWLIQTDETPDEVYNRLRIHITQNDRLLIIKAEPLYQGWLPPDAWEWMKKMNWLGPDDPFGKYGG